MLKAVISKALCPTLPPLASAPKSPEVPLFLQSSSNGDSSTDPVTTKVLTHQPFFQNPYNQKIQNLETELRSILGSHMSSSQKALLYQSALNEILRTDKRRKMKRPPATLRPRLPIPQHQQGAPLPLQQPQRGGPPHPPPLLPLAPAGQRRRPYPQPPIPDMPFLTPPRKPPKIATGRNPQKPRPYTPQNRDTTRSVRKKLELGDLGVYPETVTHVSPARLRTRPWRNYSDITRKVRIGQKKLKKNEEENTFL